MSTELSVYDKVNDVPSINALGKAIAFSGMFGCDKEEQGVVLALQCIAERKPPLEMAKNYHLINGKLSKRTDSMLADFRSRGGKWFWADLKDKECQSAEVEWEGRTYQVSYSTADAKAAGLLPAKPGSGWVKFPANMLRARCVSETLRAIAPELVSGVYTPEEISDFEPRAAAKDVTPSYRPAPKPEPAPVVVVSEDDIPMTHSGDLETLLKPYEDQVNRFLLKQKRVKDGQTWRDLPANYLAAIKKDSGSFLQTVGVKGDSNE